MVRSHEYYTGIAFEIDVLGETDVFVEVGGGGRYDRLVAHFVPEGTVPTVPATGFAFGVERLVHLLDCLGLLGPGRTTAPAIGLRLTPTEVLMIPPPTPAGYLSAVRAATRHRAAGRAVDIYLGAPAHGRSYATERGIGETQSLLVAEDQ